MSAKVDTRLTLENLEIQRFFWAPSFEIYNGVAGLYDQGPSGFAIEKNLLQRWRDHFVIEEDMLEVRCSQLTPYCVLESSGHTAKFSDYLVSDSKNPNQLFRADQLIEQVLSKRLETEKDPAKIAALQREIADAGDYNKEQLIKCFHDFDIKSPDGNELTEPIAFNLMFNTRIGPGVNSIPGFLRPETAQGIFVNFPRLFEFNRCQLPFACAQIGPGFRNEIAPRNGLVRCREFQMAEVEHFCDPEALNDFPKFATVSSLRVNLLSAPNQEEGKPMEELTLGEAVSRGIICHQTHGYYIGRVYLFLRSLGIEHSKIRFRQHRKNEKAHYSRDCWDAEMICNSTGGWLECVGIADRQSFDLTQHARATGKGSEMNNKMIVKVPLPKPIQEERVIANLNKKVIGQKFKKLAGALAKAIDELTEARKEELEAAFKQAEALLPAKPKAFDAEAAKVLTGEAAEKFNVLTKVEIEVDDQKCVLDYSMIAFQRKVVTTNTRSFIPNVIEPSFGIGRIMTVLMEHAFYLRKEADGSETKRVLRLPPFLAPYKCCIMPLTAKSTSQEQLDAVKNMFKRAKIPAQVDSSAVTIGKRYARSDELGTPFDITMDFQTNEDGTVTLRERDSMKQVRIAQNEAVKVIRDMVEETLSWEDVMKKYPVVQVNENE